jgi:hypothetical protein
VLREILGELLREVVERIRVLAQLLGRAHEGLVDAGTELLLHDGQHGAAHPHPREGAVVVLRVEPRLESGIRAGLDGRRAPDAEQRPPVEAARPLHALQAGRPAAPGQTQQHRLRLVVERVAEQDRGGTAVGRGLLEGGVAGGAGGGLGSTIGADGHLGDDHGVKAQVGGLLRGAGRGIPGSCLQTVVDDHGAGAESGARCLERGGRGEREGVGTAGEGDEHEGRRRGLGGLDLQLRQ